MSKYDLNKVALKINEITIQENLFAFIYNSWKWTFICLLVMSYVGISFQALMSANFFLMLTH